MSIKETKYYECTEFGNFETHSKTEHSYCLKCNKLEQENNDLSASLVEKTLIADKLRVCVESYANDFDVFDVDGKYDGYKIARKTLKELDSITTINET